MHLVFACLAAGYSGTSATQHGVNRSLDTSVTGNTSSTVAGASKSSHTDSGQLHLVCCIPAPLNVLSITLSVLHSCPTQCAVSHI